MTLFIDGAREAFRLAARLDPEIIEITWLSIRVSGTATLIALVCGLPLGMAIALCHFPGRRLTLGMVNTGMGLPPVVVGLFVAMLLWRSGPLGRLDFLYTPSAMVFAQAIIAWPIVVGLTAASVQQLDPRLRLQAIALGATGWRVALTLAREARLPLLAAVMAGFGAVISEVGAVMMVGGNLKGYTRVLTTATVQEARMGRFDRAIALGLILLVLTFAVNYVLTVVQQGGDRWRHRRSN